MFDPLTLTTIALCLKGEAGGESITAKNAVFHVIVNRSVDPLNRWPKDPYLVAVQPYQFSCFNPGGSMNFLPRVKSGPEWNSWQDCITVITTNLGDDPTNGANFYHDESIPPPYKQWLGATAKLEDLIAKKTVQIGRLIFYKL